MTYNFDIIRNYLIDSGIPMKMSEIGDLFFNIMLIRRGKDHPDLPAANYTFKSYYIDCIEKYDKYEDEIIKCCDLFGLRAYVSVNIKSKQKFSKMLSFEYSRDVLNGEFKKPWRRIDHTFGKIDGVNKAWIVDIDDEYLDKDDHILETLVSVIRKCQSKFDDPIIEIIPTKSGYHLLTRPFNTHEFERKFNEIYKDINIPDIKKNHITLLYENINKI